MKIFVLLALCFVSAGAVSGITADAKSAIRDGAIGKYIYRVVDDDGRPVTNASAHVWFSSYGRSQDNANWVVKTDTNGMFIAEHRLNEKFSVGIDKEGYYHTHDEINYLAMLELPVKDGKWQPYGETRTVVLKKMFSPCTCIPFDRSLRDTAIPAFGLWLGFDLEKGGWVQPWARGCTQMCCCDFRHMKLMYIRIFAM